MANNNVNFLCIFLSKRARITATLQVRLCVNRLNRMTTIIQDKVHQEEQNNNFLL